MKKFVILLALLAFAFPAFGAPKACDPEQRDLLDAAKALSEEFDWRAAVQQRGINPATTTLSRAIEIVEALITLDSATRNQASKAENYTLLKALHNQRYEALANKIDCPDWAGCGPWFPPATCVGYMFQICETYYNYDTPGSGQGGETDLCLKFTDRYYITPDGGTCINQHQTPGVWCSIDSCY